jgi:hypothetical protein
MRRGVVRVAIGFATAVLSAVGARAEAPIKIAVNPEVRVSVSRGGELPPPVSCGEALEVPVSIVNQGFLTAPLEATLVDSVPEGASVLFSPEPLTGMREERRTLRITLTKPGLVDITVAFRAKRDISDLGGRDRIHLLVECRLPKERTTG